jgi:hypothetical protein
VLCVYGEFYDAIFFKDREYEIERERIRENEWYLREQIMICMREIKKLKSEKKKRIREKKAYLIPLWIARQRKMEDLLKEHKANPRAPKGWSSHELPKYLFK